MQHPILPSAEPRAAVEYTDDTGSPFWGLVVVLLIVGGVFLAMIGADVLDPVLDYIAVSWQKTVWLWDNFRWLFAVIFIWALLSGLGETSAERRHREVIDAIRERDAS